MADVKHVVLLHGWGLNSAIWDDFALGLRLARPEVVVHQMDLPGYGHNAQQGSSASLMELAKTCLNQAPEQAVWVGWSLGGLLAMQIALLGSTRVQGLQLISSTPKFTSSDDWVYGVDLTIFKRFRDELANDYQKTLTKFLLLQAGSSKGARDLARAAHASICQLPAPDAKTLGDGIECLANHDLRSQLGSVSVPTQVVSGRLDRVTTPQSSRFLAAELRVELVELHCGHAPFFTHQADTLDALLRLLDRVEQGRPK